VRVFAHAHVSVITYRVSVYRSRRIPTHRKPSAGMPGPERSAHAERLAGCDDRDPLQTDLDWVLSSNIDLYSPTRGNNTIHTHI